MIIDKDVRPYNGQTQNVSYTGNWKQVSERVNF